MIQIGVQPATIDAPVDHLVACHRRIEQRLDTLVAAVAHLESDKAAALAAIASSLHFMDTNGAMHTQDEEISLFPRLRSRLSDPEAEFIDSLEAQHLEAEAIYAELKQLISEQRFDAKYLECANRLRTLYRAHILREDETLIALARRTLEESELLQISREMRERRESASTRATNRYMPKQAAQSTPEAIAPGSAVSE
ncbi:MAG: Hemerythrin cation binding domain protein [Bryobacterales bacterium]|nr:Hemerythrin cation binding domain protein [Bryobacterales bacterium]